MLTPDCGRRLMDALCAMHVDRRTPFWYLKSRRRNRIRPISKGLINRFVGCFVLDVWLEYWYDYEMQW